MRLLTTGSTGDDPEAGGIVSPVVPLTARGRSVSDDLVTRAQRGDHEAFGRLAAATIGRLYSVARRVLRDPASAEDAVQECLFRAWRDIRALRDPARFDAWLYRLLLHACRDEQRRAKRRPVQVAIDAWDPPAPADEIAAVDRREDLERAFRGMNADQRMVLVLHYYQGWSAREIADVLGIPEGTVVSRTHYGSRALRRALDGTGPATSPAGGAR